MFLWVDEVCDVVFFVFDEDVWILKKEFELLVLFVDSYFVDFDFEEFVDEY